MSENLEIAFNLCYILGDINRKSKRLNPFHLSIAIKLIKFILHLGINKYWQNKEFLKNKTKKQQGTAKVCHSLLELPDINQL